MLTMAAAEIALLGLVNRHGAQATAAYGAVTQLMSWLQLPAMSRASAPPSWPPTPSAPDAATGWAPSPAPG